MATIKGDSQPITVTSRHDITSVCIDCGVGGPSSGSHMLNLQASRFRGVLVPLDQELNDEEPDLRVKSTLTQEFVLRSLIKMQTCLFISHSCASSSSPDEQTSSWNHHDRTWSCRTLTRFPFTGSKLLTSSLKTSITLCVPS